MNVIGAAGVVQTGEVSPERTFEAIAVPDARRLYSLALSILRDEGRQRGCGPGRSDPGGPADFVDIDRAYRQLSLRQRAALTLSYRHGYSVKECAELARDAAIRAPKGR